MDYLRNIAEIQIKVAAVEHCLKPFTTPHYQAFTFSLPAADCQNPDISVRLDHELPDLAESMSPLFDSKESWSMHAGKESYKLIFRWSAGHEPDMSVVSDSFTRNVVIGLSGTGKKQAEPAAEIVDPMRYPLDQILLMNHLAYRKGIILHSAGLIVDNAGLLFAGISGAGKSTLMRLFQSAAPNIQLLSDDRIILREVNESYRAYGTPWPGEGAIANNSFGPLKALFFLSKGTNQSIHRMPASQALKRLFPVISCPWYDPMRLPPILDTCERLVRNVPFYELLFAPEKSVVDLILEFVQKQKIR